MSCLRRGDIHLYEKTVTGESEQRPEAGTCFRVRKDKVDTGGTVTLRHNSRLLHIGVGRAYKNRSVMIFVADLEIRVVDEDGELIRRLRLDPERDYQPNGTG